MRNIGRLSLIVLAGAACAVAGGCAELEDRNARPALGYPSASRVSHSGYTKVRVPLRTADSGKVKLRRFCDQRHIAFQAGRLDETPERHAINDEMCRNVYTAEPSTTNMLKGSAPSRTAMPPVHTPSYPTLTTTPDPLPPIPTMPVTAPPAPTTPAPIKPTETSTPSR